MDKRKSSEPKLVDCTCARPGCEVVFPVRKSQLARQGQPYCSRSCSSMNRGKPKREEVIHNPPNIKEGKMKTFTATFGDNDEYEASLEIEPGETQGWLSLRRSGYSASLAALDATGVLTNGRDEELAVPQEVIAEVMAWAEKNGY